MQDLGVLTVFKECVGRVGGRDVYRPQPLDTAYPDVALTEIEHKDNPYF